MAAERALTSADLRRLADELDAEHEKTSRELADADSARERKELRDELAELREKYGKLERLAVEQGFVLDTLDADDDPAGGKPKPKPKGKGKPKGKDEPEPKPTRPGRKSGSAYDWDVDEQGRVVKLDVAQVYGGDDEPDEVELPDDDDDDDDD